MEERKCKHCGSELRKVLMPPDSDWGVEYHYVCMDDNCPYYANGWKWMQDNYRVRASYRYYQDPFSGNDGPLPVANPADLKHYVVE